MYRSPHGPLKEPRNSVVTPFVWLLLVVYSIWLVPKILAEEIGKFISRRRSS